MFAWIGKRGSSHQKFTFIEFDLFINFLGQFYEDFAATKAFLVLIKSRCRNSCSQMFFKIGVLKNFAIFTVKHLRKNTIFNKVAGLQFSCEYCESFKSSFFIKHLRWLLQQMFCFTLYLKQNVDEYNLNIHCIIVSFWNLKSLSFVFIRCATRCHLLYHSLSFVVPLVVICCHSLSRAVICCTTRCHSLSLAVPLVVTLCHSIYHSSVF